MAENRNIVGGGDLARQRCAAPDEPAAPCVAASALTVWMGECDQLSVG